MRSKHVAGIALLVAALVVGVSPLVASRSLHGGGTTSGEAAAAGDVGVGLPVAAPVWDDDTLRSCQDWCAWQYFHDKKAYNVCFACTCLLAAAETGGETVSAAEQCKVALRGNRLN
jgi:hypothetical protein